MIHRQERSKYHEFQREFQKGDKVVILGEAWVTAEEAVKMSPTVAFMDDKNQITEVKKGWRPS